MNASTRTGLEIEGSRIVSHDELVQRAARWLVGTRRCAVVYTEPVTCSLREIPDAIGFTPAGWSIVVECKTGRPDFLGDKHKAHRRSDRDELCRGLGNERWYFIADPQIIVDGDELFGWGVLFPTSPRDRAVGGDVPTW